MLKRNLALAVGAMFLLSHCATKHQPIAFAPYFSEDSTGPSQVEGLSEIRLLENSETLTPLAKKRLFDLYQWELKTLKSSSSRYAQVKLNMELLKPVVAEMEEETRRLQKENTANIPAAEKEGFGPKNPFQNNPTLKKEYSDILRLWNEDQTDLALKRIEDDKKGILQDAKTLEKLRFSNLKMRILLELGNLDAAEATYREMKDEEDCDADVAQAGFLMALHRFAAKDNKKAFEIFDDQCDPDKTPSNLIRRKYWQARFNPNPEKAQALYKEIANPPYPGYHAFLAQIQLGQKIIVTGAPKPEIPERVFLHEEFSVPNKVHNLLSAAEDRLKVGLRRDASIFLTKASRILRDDPDEDSALGALYTAHLAHAAGNHLESMRLYTSVSNLILENEIPEEWITPQLLSDMFPRPYQGRVESLARMWRVDPDFVYAIVRQESAFNPGAVSSADARGLMQMLPALARTLARQWGYKKYFTEKSLYYGPENLKLGVFHIQQLHDYLPHYALIAASYNAGLNRVLRWWKRTGNLPTDVFVELIPVNETKNYVKLVMRNMVYYRWFRTGAPIDASVIPMDLGIYPREYSGSYSRLDLQKISLPHTYSMRAD